MADDSPLSGVVIGARAIYDEVVVIRNLVSPLPEMVRDHEQRIRDLDASKLSVKDYREERTEDLEVHKDFEARLRRVEKLSAMLGGVKGLVAWGGTCVGGVFLATYLEHVTK